MARRFLKMTAVKRLSDFDFEGVCKAAATSTSDSAFKRNNEIQCLHEITGAILAGWPLEEIEEEAWVFALEGWQRVPPLARDYDTIFQRYIEVADSCRDFEPRPGMAPLVAHLGELRNRVQFLQARAGDIRLSGQLGSLIDATVERLSPKLEEILRLLQSTDPRGALAAYEREGKGDLILALSNRLGMISPELGAAVVISAQSLPGRLLLAVGAQMPKAVAAEFAKRGLPEALEYLASRVR